MPKILVTPRSLTKEGDPSLALLREAGYEVIMCTPGKSPGEDELIRLLPGCVGWLASVRISFAAIIRVAFQHHAGVRIVLGQHIGSGADRVPVEG